MERLKLQKLNKGNKTYSRITAKRALDNIIKKLEEVNYHDEFIYKVTKAVLFGSYINSSKDKLGDVDIAIYVELKNKDIPELEQNYNHSKQVTFNMPFVFRYTYGKEEVFKFLKDKKRVIQLHDGDLVDYEAKKYGYEISYIYFDKSRIIYENNKGGDANGITKYTEEKI